ncbi:MAG: amino acid ABC transporter permease [Actinobacteria bacterium]|nr:amino acid ABC transporter permease [Actinomycetota bacterium]MCA1721499.1 amino acid ABC transporter permease [Actinomycetota bacterium]
MASAPAGAAEPPVIVPVRHPGRVVGGAVVLILLGLLGLKLGTLDKINYPSITAYLFQRSIVEGVITTVELAVLSQLIGTVLGTLLATMRMSPNPVLSSVSWLYIWFFRGTPLIVQILFWYNGLLYLLPRSITITLLPGVTLFNGLTADLLTIFVAATLALALNEAAYMAEIVRGGILAVDSGQQEAAAALGMTSGQTLRRVVLPQAMRVIIPPTGNELISMLKNTSLVVVIGQTELLGRTTAIYSQSGEVFELLVMASIWYLALTSVSYVGQYYLERRFARGSLRDLPPTPLQRLRRVAR